MPRRKRPIEVHPPIEIVPMVVVLEEPAEPALDIPSHWQHGALLNVRNGGEYYIVTLYPEEYDHRSPERALMFTNVGRCQDFVSKWYARQNHDPRAY